MGTKYVARIQGSDQRGRAEYLLPGVRSRCALWLMIFAPRSKPRILQAMELRLSDEKDVGDIRYRRV